MLKHGIKQGLFVSALLTLLFMAALLPVAADEGIRVYEPTGIDLLTADEETKLTELLDRLSDKYGVELYLATYHADNYRDDFVGDDYCRDVRDVNGENAVLFILTYDDSDGKYYYDMYTFGKANNRIKQPEINYILDSDAVYDNIKGGRLATGSEAFFTQSAKAYDGRVGTSYTVIIPVCAGIALVIALIACWGVYGSYRRRKPTVDYPLDRFAKLDLTREKDAFITTTITRVYDPPNKSGGSKGGGKSTHGGGGGHRGGR